MISCKDVHRVQTLKQFERRKVYKRKQTYTKTEACKLYSRVFWILLPNFIKIDRYNFELYCFKVCVARFFEAECTFWEILSLICFLVADIHRNVDNEAVYVWSRVIADLWLLLWSVRHQFFLSSEKFTEVLNQQRQERAEKDRERIRLLTADPFDPEAQRLIAEEIRQAKLLYAFND